MNVHFDLQIEHLNVPTLPFHSPFFVTILLLFFQFHCLNFISIIKIKETLFFASQFVCVDIIHRTFLRLTFLKLLFHCDCFHIGKIVPNVFTNWNDSTQILANKFGGEWNYKLSEKNYKIRRSLTRRRPRYQDIRRKIIFYSIRCFLSSDPMCLCT